jgi:TfoX/Sxy family transcriptional regulator of competence genes
MGADAEQTYQAIAERLLASDPDIEHKPAFGSPGLRYRDKIFAMHVRGDLVVKLPERRCEDLAGGGAARPFRVGQRVMREWAVIGSERDFEWDARADEALGYARRSASATSSP